MLSSATREAVAVTRESNLRVPFMDLKAQFGQIREQVLTALAEVAESTCYVLGPRVHDFEAEFAQFTGAKHCIALNSGTSALHLALIAAGVGPGDEVITAPMTFVATAWAIRYVGATPVFADVDPQTYTLDPNEVERRITPRTKAILPVHLYGQPAALSSLVEISSRHRVALIEDAAQAHAASYQGRHVGTFGLCGCFSFYPGKNLGAYGEGGAVVSNDDDVANRIRSLRDHAQRERYRHEELGFNYRMDAFQGAVLSIKLKHLNAWTEARRRIANRYLERLTDSSLTLPYAAGDRRQAWHLFVCLHRDRDRIRAVLAERDIQTGLHYPIPVHLQPAFRDLGHLEGDFPVAERIGRECLSLPLFPEMTEVQQNAVIDAIGEAND